MISLRNNKKLPAPSLSHPSDHLNHQDGRKIEGETKKIHSGKKKGGGPLYLAEMEVKGLRNGIMNDVSTIVFVFMLSLGWKELAF